MRVFYLIKVSRDMEDYIGSVVRKINYFVAAVLNLDSGRSSKVNN